MPRRRVPSEVLRELERVHGSLERAVPAAGGLRALVPRAPGLPLRRHPPEVQSLLPQHLPQLRGRHVLRAGKQKGKWSSLPSVTERSNLRGFPWSFFRARGQHSQDSRGLRQDNATCDMPQRCGGVQPFEDNAFLKCRVGLKFQMCFKKRFYNAYEVRD